MFKDFSERIYRYKVTFVSSRPGLIPPQIKVLVGISRPEPGTVTELPPFDDGEKTVLGKLRWPLRLPPEHADFGAWIYLFQAPTNRDFARTRATVMQGSDIVVLHAGTAPALRDANLSLMDEIRALRAREPAGRLIVQYILADDGQASRDSRDSLRASFQADEKLIELDAVGKEGFYDMLPKTGTAIVDHLQAITLG